VRIELMVSDFLRRSAFVAPDEVAIVDEPDVKGALGSVTYGSMASRAASLASRLDQMGVAHGARIAIVSPNSAKFLCSFFGVSGYGRILVPVNYRLNAREVSYIVEHSGAEVVLYDPDLDALVDDLAVPHLVRLDGEDDESFFCEHSERPEPLEPPADENSTCSVNYTSGTTANPKGVQLTHRNCWLNAASFGWHLGISQRDVLLYTLPMFHANGWGTPYAATAMAARHVVLRKVDGEEVLRRVEREGVTLLCGAPAVVAMVLDAAARRTAEGRTIPGAGTVRIVVAGAPPPTRTIERVDRELGWEFVQIYGLTETSPLLTVNRAHSTWDDLDPSDRARRLSRAGVPAVGVEIAVDVDGEVLARSNHVFAGYWEQPLETERALEGGWFHTGDGGNLDDAYLVITDRRKDVIITGGENVSSIEVEDCLFAHPAVAEVAVIGVPDTTWGETVKALVVLRDGSSATEGELIEHCRGTLAHFKCPTSVEFRDELARTATGKLQKFKLREPYWEGRDRAVN
jgi:acyl-CoA synthetase (AMP-forming)/AMP-acid ligase II